MQRILSLQLTDDSLSALLAGVGDGQLNIISEASQAIDPDKLAVIREFYSLSGSPSSINSNEDEEQGDEAADSEMAEISDAFSWLSAQMKECLSQIEGGWDRSILVVPANHTLTLNLELPFSHPRQIERIIELEVQDRVPFSTENFFIHSKALTPLENGSFDIHVTLIPKLYVEKLMAVCKEVDLDPPIITTHDQIPVGVFELFPELTEKNTTVIIDADDCLYTSSYLADSVRSSSLIPLPPQNGTGKSVQERKAVALRNHQRVFLSLEKRYKDSFSSIVVFSDDLQFSNMAAEIFKQSVKQYPLADIQPLKEKSFSTALSLLLAASTAKGKLLCNLRAGRYAYRPQIKELIQASKKLIVPFVALLICLSISLSVIYGVRSYRISALSETLSEQAAKVLPSVSIPPGSEISTLRARYGQLNRQLNESSAALRISPLQTVVELAQIFRSDKSVEIRRLRIYGDKIDVEGEAPDYESVDKMKSKLKRKRDYFCRVNKDETTPGPGNSKRFKFQISLCSK